jgi:hypothetical protein
MFWLQLMQLSPLHLLRDEIEANLPADVLLDLFPQFTQVHIGQEVPLEQILEKFENSLAPIKVRSPK